MSKIMIFTADQTALQVYGKDKVTRGGIKNAASLGTEIAVEVLQENIKAFISGLDSILSSSPKNIGGLELDEIEIHANIDGKGNIGIVGIGGAEISAQGGIKFILRKK